MAVKMGSNLPIAPELAIAVSTIALMFILEPSTIWTYLFTAIISGMLIAAFLQYHPGGRIHTIWGHRLLLTISFLGVSSMALLAYSTPFGVPLLFYILLALVVGVISLLAIIAPTKQLLFPIVLFAITIRGAYWYSAPIIGADVRAHLAFTRYIVEHGRIIPESIVYYHFYPIGHLISASVSEVTGLPVRASFFLAIGGGTVGGIAVIALLTRKIVPDKFSTRSLLFAALFLSVSHWHLAMSGKLIVQSLMLLFVPLALLAFVSNGMRRIFIGLFAAMVLLITHNAPGLVLVVFGGMMLFTNYLGQRIALPVVQRKASQNLVAAIGIGLLSYWMVVDYLSFQIGRILRVFQPGDSLNQAASQSTEVVQASTFDPLLWPAADLLFGGVFLTAILFIVIRNRLRNEPGFALDYLVATSTIYAGTGIVLFIALNTQISRLVPLGILFAAPIVGYVMANIATTGRRGLAVCLALILVLPSLTFISAAESGYAFGDAPTEYRTGFQQNWLSTSEFGGAKTASRMTDQMSTSGYITSSLARQQEIPFRTEGVRGLQIMQSGWPSDCEAFYARSYYREAFEIHPPEGTDVILDVGDAQLFRCV